MKKKHKRQNETEDKEDQSKPKIKLELTDKVPSKKKVKMKKQSKNIKVTPYREITFSDGHGFFIKTTCNITSDNRVQVIQYRENTDPEGMKFLCTEPEYFENKSEFLEWIVQLLLKNFDDIPYITIAPIKEEDIKRQERENLDAMYL